MHKLRFRQVHLDYHTSEAIENIGSRFDKKQFQAALEAGHVDSITCFAKCHHGWSYYESKVGPMHPHLSFDLLRAQFDACKELDINVPIYLSAGLDEMMTRENPQWLLVPANPKEREYTPPLKAVYRRLCFNSPYLEYLCRQIQEVVQLYPNCDGIFLDIICQTGCVCTYCRQWMHSRGMEATNAEHVEQCRQHASERYYQMATDAVRSIDPEMPIFHNSGHIQRGRRDILKYFSHLELESLPTGGWGYDHFPLSAKYCKNLDLDILGMTGKFHTTWGEFGGYKHPNALKYECAAMIAYGAKCSVGDQLHPEGEMADSTYKLIGTAYEHVEKCEPFCDEVTNLADIGLLSAQCFASEGRHAGDDPDVGAARILLEGHFLFDVIDPEMNFDKYKMLILPDGIDINTELKAKLDTYLSQGGKLMLTGQSGIDNDTGEFLFDLGAECRGQSEFCPDYILPVEEIRPDFVSDPIVMYLRSRRIKVTDGISLGKVYDPYFNRAYNHFCSHQHTPYKASPSEFDCGVTKANLLYLAHPVFSLYRGMGAVVYKDYAINAIRHLLRQSTVKTNLPSTARITLMDQPKLKRLVVHLLYANTINRGGPMKLEGGTKNSESTSVEVIEELNPLNDIELQIQTDKKITAATLQPQDQSIDFIADGDIVTLKVDRFICHQMIALEYK